MVFIWLSGERKNKKEGKPPGLPSLSLLVQIIPFLGGTDFF
jgi:hypothetical protein